MTAGVASAEITWTGTATAGIARIGTVDAITGTLTDLQLDALATITGVTADGAISANELTAMDAYRLTAAGKIWIAAKAKALGIVATTSDDAADLVLLDAWLAQNSASASDVTILGGGGSSSVIVIDLAGTNITATQGADTRKDVYDAVLAARNVLALAVSSKALNYTAGAVAGDYKTYSEINLTGAASVTTDSGLTFETAISVDAGQGYNLADDEGFDTLRTTRNGGSVGLDYVSVGGAFGTITIDEGDIPMLVDVDDNLSGDISYKGTFGDVTVQAVFDQAKDGNAVATAGTTIGINGATATVAGVIPDVAWSAAVSGTVQGVSYRYATDEEGGYAGSLGYTMSGVTVGVSTKLEAAEKDLNKPVHNGVSVAYAVEGLSLSGAWDSVKDGNQTSWGVGYTGGDATVGFNTNQKNEWTATASLALGAGASLNAGVNYTDDAQVGVSFSF